MGFDGCGRGARGGVPNIRPQYKTKYRRKQLRIASESSNLANINSHNYAPFSSATFLLGEARGGAGRGHRLFADAPAAAAASPRDKCQTPTAEVGAP